ncbi:MAG: sugar phosphate isomerase/epimerase [Ruminococcaceae bacterium]|nr:sugar phosphate isomerase/epimerase [Oscillospiraceae bacterium]
MKYEVSLAIGAFQDVLGAKGALDLAKEIGLTCVDFDLLKYDGWLKDSVYTKSDDEIASYFEDLKRYADSIGVRIGQTHGRIKGYKLDEVINENEKKGARLDMMATKLLGCRHCVIHSVGLGLDASAEDQRRYNRRMFDDYLPFAKEFGVKIASETFGDTTTPDGRSGIDFFGDETEFLNAYREISEKDGNAPFFCTCMDTGHTNKAARFDGQPLPHELIYKLGSSIECLHLNDNDHMTDQHKVPLSGTIDWQLVLEALRDVGYEGSWNMELNLYHFGRTLDMAKAYADFSVKVMNQLLIDVLGE